MQEEPIVVVGASRSGTALIRSSLNQHARIHLAGETHYFDDLRARMPAAATSVLSAEQRQLAEDYFLAVAHRPYGHGGDPARSPLDRERLRARAYSIGVGLDSYFEAYCRIDAEDHGKAHGRWGEKTPRHVYRIPDILARYPRAHIVCAVRDPRAVVCSYRDWRNRGGFDLESDPEHRAALEADEERAARSYDLRLATLLWRSTVGASTGAQSRFGGERVWIQRYEDLVAEPERSMRRLTQWLGLEFEEGMLDVPVHNSSFSSFDPHGGVSAAPIRRWESRLSTREVATIQLLAGNVMRSQGYQPLDTSTSRLSVVAGLTTLPVAVARAATANRSRMGSIPGYMWRRARTVVSARRSG